MPGLKELGSVLGCAMAVGLLVVAGDFSDYSGFGRVELAQAQVHLAGANAVQNKVVALAAPAAPAASLGTGGDKAALKAAVRQKMATLAKTDGLHLQAPPSALAQHISEHAVRGTNNTLVQKQSLSLVPGWSGLDKIDKSEDDKDQAKKKKVKSQGLKAIERLKASLIAGEAHERFEDAERHRESFEKRVKFEVADAGRGARKMALAGGADAPIRRRRNAHH